MRHNSSFHHHNYQPETRIHFITPSIAITPSHIRFVTRPSSISSAYKKKKKRELVAEHVYDPLGESFFPLQRTILLQKRQDSLNWNVEQFSIYSRLISFNNNNNNNKRLLFHEILVKEPSSNFFEINSSLERRALFVITRTAARWPISRQQSDARNEGTKEARVQKWSRAVRGVSTCVRKTALESARVAGGEGYAKARLSMAAAGELCKEDDDGAHDSLINTTSRDDSRQGRESGRPLTAIRCSNSTGSCTQRMQGIHFRGPKIAFIGREMGFFNPFYRELGETCEKMSIVQVLGLEGAWFRGRREN